MCLLLFAFSNVWWTSEVVITQIEQVQRNGDDITLTCSVTGSNQVTVTLLKEEEQLVLWTTDGYKDLKEGSLDLPDIRFE